MNLDNRKHAVSETASEGFRPFYYVGGPFDGGELHLSEIILKSKPRFIMTPEENLGKPRINHCYSVDVETCTLNYVGKKTYRIETE